MGILLPANLFLKWNILHDWDQLVSLYGFSWKYWEKSFSFSKDDNIFDVSSNENQIKKQEIWIRISWQK